jgi:hypothetical protein
MPMAHDMAHEMGHGAGMDIQAMVRDMRNRFWVSLVFSVPIFIYSPMGNMFTPPAPPFGLRLDLWLFFLATAAIVYPAWPFVVAAIRALRNGILNMAVLVLLSVGTGYVFSVGATFFFAGQQFYEASAVLLVFILLGHWLEMRARAGASEAIRALLDLAPTFLNKRRRRPLASSSSTSSMRSAGHAAHSRSADTRRKSRRSISSSSSSMASIPRRGSCSCLPPTGRKSSIRKAHPGRALLALCYRYCHGPFHSHPGQKREMRALQHRAKANPSRC